MDQEAIITEIERRAHEARVSIATVCKRAGVHPTTFSRWKKSPRNPNPIGANLATLKRIDEALRDIERPRRRRRSHSHEGVQAA